MDEDMIIADVVEIDENEDIQNVALETLLKGKDGEDYVITTSDYQAIADVVESQIDIPTKYSDLTNDNYTVQDSRYVHTDNNFTDDYKTDLLAAYNVSHFHLNKFVIDGISAADIYNWNGKGTYSKPSGGIPSTDLSSDVQTSLGKADTALQEETYTGTITSVKMNGSTISSSGEADLGTVITSHQDITGKQDIEDNTLQTVYKTVPAAINEVNSVAKGANQALSYSNYQAMVTAFNALDKTTYKVGQNIYINTLDVPDLWISKIEDTSSTYTYTSDEALIASINLAGFVQIGYYKLSELETQKVDLAGYVTNTDYATSSVGGVVKVNSYYGVTTSSGTLIGSTNTYSDYTAKGNSFLVCKGTLENVLTGKNLETTGNKVTSLSSSSTDTEYPSAKCVYDIVGNIETLLSAI